VEEVRGVEGLESLREAWGDLCGRCPWATPFQRPEWLIPWARHFGGPGVAAIALKDGEALLGLLPLWVSRRKRSEKIVSLLGQGLSDYLDVVVDPQRAPDWAQRLIDRLLSWEEVWNTLSLESLRMTSPLMRVVFPAGWREDIAPRMPTLVLPLNAVEALATRRLRTSLRQAHRRAEAQGGISFEQARGTAVRPALEALFLLHHKRWALR
jgi:CelD/BcsL family acetyltransferase involved in cellulose biosynthesis